MMPLKKSSLVEPAALPSQWLLSDIGMPMSGVIEVLTTGDWVQDQAVQPAFEAQVLGSPMVVTKLLNCFSKSASAAASLPFGLPKYPPTTYLDAMIAMLTFP